MSAQYKDLGKVCLTTGGIWSSSRTYEILTLVYDDVNNTSYISKKDVPAGTSLSNTSYWQLVVDGANATIEVDNKLDGQSTNPVQNRVITDKFQDLDEAIDDIKANIKNIDPCDCVVDSALSSSSTNPLENKAIYSLLQGIYNRLSALENGGGTTTHTLSVVLSASPTAVTKGDTTTLSWVAYYDGSVVTNALTVNSLYVNGEEVQQTIDSAARSYTRTVNTDESYKITVSYNGLYATSNTVSVTATEESTDDYTAQIADYKVVADKSTITLGDSVTLTVTFYDSTGKEITGACTYKWKCGVNGGTANISTVTTSTERTITYTPDSANEWKFFVDPPAINGTSAVVTVNAAEETHTLSVELSGPSTATVNELFNLSWKILYDGTEVGTDTAVTSQSIVFKSTNNSGGFKQSDNTIRSNQFSFGSAGTYNIYAIVEYQGLTATSNTISIVNSEVEETHTYSVSISPSTVTVDEGESVTFTFTPTIDGSSNNVEITGFGVIDDSGVVTNGTDTTFTLTKNSLTAGTHTYTLNVDFSDGGTASTTFTVIVNEVETTTTVYYGRSQADPTAETYTSFNAATMDASETSGTYDFADVGSPTETYNFYYLIVPKTMYISSDIQVSLASPLEDMWETATEIEGTDYKFYRSLQRQSNGNEIKVNYNSSSDNATYVRDREFEITADGTVSGNNCTLNWVITSEGSTVQTGSGNPLNGIMQQYVKVGINGTDTLIPNGYRSATVEPTTEEPVAYIVLLYRNTDSNVNSKHFGAGYDFSDSGVLATSLSTDYLILSDNE